METEPLSYASSPESRPKKRRTNFGALALLLAIAFTLLLFVATLLPHNGSSNVEQQISNWMFDFGFPYMLLTLALIIVGLIHGGRSRWMAVAALLVNAVPCFFGFM